MRKESNCSLTARSFSVWCFYVVVFLVAASAQAQVITLSPTSLYYGNVTVAIPQTADAQYMGKGGGVGALLGLALSDGWDVWAVAEDVAAGGARRRV